MLRTTDHKTAEAFKKKENWKVIQLGFREWGIFRADEEIPEKYLKKEEEITRPKRKYTKRKDKAVKRYLKGKKKYLKKSGRKR